MVGLPGTRRVPWQCNLPLQELQIALLFRILDVGEWSDDTLDLFCFVQIAGAQVLPAQPCAKNYLGSEHGLNSAKE